ncbi:hypothetical protein VM1G_11317 [Cytospora mali]|uniref:Uncharacterized protein n=1 Tax=Cytospora mali TaxID=578113 RepID=A0A194VNC8_CYTMA|nr:hypothetical protein VM1G_11317 [Valsa mali]
MSSPLSFNNFQLDLPKPFKTIGEGDQMNKEERAVEDAALDGGWDTRLRLGVRCQKAACTKSGGNGESLGDDVIKVEKVEILHRPYTKAQG